MTSVLNRPSNATIQTGLLENRVMDEVCVALGIPRGSALRIFLRPLLWLPARNFVRIAARFEAEIPRTELPGACHQMVGDLSVTAIARGEEQVPRQGPLLIVSNHPGAYDSISIVSCIPRRDLKMFVSDVPFLRALPETSQRFLFVPGQSNGRMAALRAGIEHLKSGGSLLIFAHGDVEPDPGFMPGAENAIAEWSPSVEIMLRKVPQAWLQIAIASDVLQPDLVGSPIARLRRKPSRQQKLAEFLQVIRQMVFPRTHVSDVHISFGSPVCASELNGEQIMADVIGRGQALLREHLAYYHPS